MGAFFANTDNDDKPEANQTQKRLTHPNPTTSHNMAAGDQQQFCLRWNDFQTNMVSSFKHPIIILKDVPFQHLTAILEFMYAGEVNVAQDQLPAFLKTAERLKVKGLAEAPQTIKQE